MGGPEETGKFFRYFQIVGMDHCSGGDGAWAINYLPILEKWVEKGEAPEVIVGKKPVPGAPIDYFGLGADRLTPDQVAFTRPYYPYPAKAYYAGKGDPDSAASFVKGTKPRGAKASTALETLKARDPATLAAEINAIASRTETAYKAAGLPDKNVSDRVGKQLRFTIYNSTLAPTLIETALRQALADQPSPVSRGALAIMLREFSAM
jgi:feruloyl esterase